MNNPAGQRDIASGSFLDLMRFNLASSADAVTGILHSNGRDHIL